MEGVPLREAALLLAQWFGILPPPPRPPRPLKEESKPEPVPPQEKESDTERMLSGPNPVLDFELQNLDPDHSYLLERGLRRDTLGQFGFGYCGKCTTFTMAGGGELAPGIVRM